MGIHKKYHSGFSLIELAMVLTIIALIAGGILIGKDLMRAAELRSLTTDINKFTVATVEFTDKYRALPGDFSRATAIWGTKPDCTTTTPTTLTCNGDGDGHIYYNVSNGLLEDGLFWQHLANAGFIEGTYSGYNTNDDNPFDVNRAPRSKIRTGGYVIRYYAYDPDVEVINYALGWDDLERSSRHQLLFSNKFTRGCDECMVAWGDALTPQDAFSIDTKIDNGKPGTGGVVAPRHTSFDYNCTTPDESTDGSIATYDLTYTGLACALNIGLGF